MVENLGKKSSFKIGERIKKTRENLGYTQTKLADLTGVSPAAISQIENESRLPSTPVLSKLADVLNVTIEYLLGKKVDPEIEDIIKDESVRALFRDFTNLSQNDKEIISKIIKSLRKETE